MDQRHNRAGAEAKTQGSNKLKIVRMRLIGVVEILLESLRDMKNDVIKHGFGDPCTILMYYSPIVFC